MALLNRDKIEYVRRASMKNFAFTLRRPQRTHNKLNKNSSDPTSTEGFKGAFFSEIGGFMAARAGSSVSWARKPQEVQHNAAVQLQGVQDVYINIFSREFPPVRGWLLEVTLSTGRDVRARYAVVADGKLHLSEYKIVCIIW